jgi:hypothetical protein
MNIHKIINIENLDPSKLGYEFDPSTESVSIDYEGGSIISFYTNVVGECCGIWCLYGIDFNETLIKKGEVDRFLDFFFKEVEKHSSGMLVINDVVDYKQKRVIYNKGLHKWLDKNWHSTRSFKNKNSNNRLKSWYKITTR